MEENSLAAFGNRVKYLDLKTEKVLKNEENYIMMTSIICTLRQILIR
jgi:hypothetical protein